MSHRIVAQRLLGGVVCLAAAGIVLLLLIAVGQPLFTDDLWWHLALGERYAELGPWLAADPFLFTAESPPAPAAWLAQLVLFGAESLVGFQGLRVLHVVLVLGLLVLVFERGRRAGQGSVALGALGVAIFCVLGAYRVIQLRPHLFTMLAALLLYWLVVEPRLPSWRRVIGAVLLQAVWVNLHAGFLLGPVLVAAATLGAGAQVAAEGGVPGQARRRLGRLATTLGLSLAATLANPEGAQPHMLLFTAGAATPELGAVGDEWSALNLWSLPPANLPPSLLTWGLVWGLVVATPWAGWRAWRRGRGAAWDPAGFAVALVSVVGMLLAVRFVWLGLFAWLFVGSVVRQEDSWRRLRRPMAALLACALLVGFVWLGAWPMISRGVSRERYRDAYPAAKWNGHAVWWLSDVGLEGRLFNPYWLGGFIGYWLSENGVRVFVNGSLNFPRANTADYVALMRRRPGPGDASFQATLERHDVDLFLGTGVAQIPQPGRFPEYTTAHLEGTPGWIPVFRNLRNAIYLRDEADNRDNLERVAAYYATQGVPFDSKRGFLPGEVVSAAPGWAVAHGVIPRDYVAVSESLATAPGARLRPGLERLASIHAALGDYEHAIALDRRSIELAPRVPALRRLVWCLLHLGRFEEAVEASRTLRSLASAGDGLSRGLADAAQRAATQPDAEKVAGLIANLPLWLEGQSAMLLAGSVEAAPRPSIRRDTEPGRSAEEGSRER